MISVVNRPSARRWIDGFKGGVKIPRRHDPTKAGIAESALDDRQSEAMALLNTVASVCSVVGSDAIAALIICRDRTADTPRRVNPQVNPSMSKP
jgi:hypothetical protein